MFHGGMGCKHKITGSAQLRIPLTGLIQKRLLQTLYCRLVFIIHDDIIAFGL